MDWLTMMYPDLPSNYVWQSSVSDEHVGVAVVSLEEIVGQAKQSRSQVDLDPVGEDMWFHLRGSSAGDYFDVAKEERDTRERLSSVTYGILFVGGAVGYAKVILEEEDLDTRLERGRELWKASDAIVDSISVYCVSDPSHNPRYLYAIECQLAFMRTSSDWNGMSIGGDPDPVDKYFPHGLVNTWGS